MKVTLMSMVVFVGLSAQAKTTCYILKNAQNAEKTIPKSLCIDSVQVNLDRPSIRVKSPSYDRILNNLDITYLARHNEESFSFRAQSVIADIKPERVKKKIN